MLSGDANFDTAQASLTPAARARLDQLVAEAHGLRFALVTTTGHTDATGSDTFNLTLAQHRAESAARYLQAHGLQAEQFVTVGRGSAQPVASNQTPEGRAQNRRVDIVLKP